MTIAEKYGLSFEKSLVDGRQLNYATSSTISNSCVADHLTCSNAIAINSQISALNDALSGIVVEEFWGEVMGSTLEIYPTTGNVEIGDRNIISIKDFKRLLEEWLAFIR